MGIVSTCSSKKFSLFGFKSQKDYLVLIQLLKMDEKEVFLQENVGW